jgi:hypothetical protein
MTRPALAREGVTEFDCRGIDGNGSQPRQLVNGRPEPGYHWREPGWQQRMARAGLDLPGLEEIDAALAPKLGRPRKEGSR